jgi:hypothetical protein
MEAKLCPKCHTINKQIAWSCSKCGNTLSVDTIINVDDSNFREFIVDLEQESKAKDSILESEKSTHTTAENLVHNQQINNGSAGGKPSRRRKEMESAGSDKSMLSPEIALVLQRQLTEAISQLDILIEKSRNLDTKIAYLEGRLPNSNILNQSFLRRAFAIWGHVLIAQIIIAIFIYGAVFVLAIIFGGLAS